MNSVSASISILVAVATISLPSRAQAPERDEFPIIEATIAGVQRGFRSGTLTPERLVRMYLARIAAYDQAGPQLNSFMVVNRLAVEAARALDMADLNADTRTPGAGQGDSDGDAKPLFGVPVILKDNIDTSDMPTTAGSIALGGSIPPQDAFITRKLRRAGAILLGKATMTEFANFLGVKMPTGYDSQLRFQLFHAGGDLATTGYGFNPFDPRADPREGLNDGRPVLATGGSSSGPAIAVSANLATVGVGTETSGSILSPANQNLLVGIKPTVGLVSRSGIVPITADQDTAGPMARTVTDAARLLGALAGYDPADAATAACLKRGNCLSDYTRFLKRDALRGARIAIPHYGYWTDSKKQVELSVDQQRVMADAIAVLRAQGATVVDFREIPTQDELFAFSGCAGLPIPANCSTVLLYGFKRDLNAYLATRGPGAPVHNLAEVIELNKRFKVGGVRVGLKYGQALAIAADSLDLRPGSGDQLRYLKDRARDVDIARTRGLDVLYQEFDAVLFPANRGANIAARAGYPSIIVPAGFVSNTAAAPPPVSPPPPFPEGFNPRPSPFGVTFSGPAFSEAKLIGFAYAYEQATQHRRPPASTPALPAQ